MKKNEKHTTGGEINSYTILVENLEEIISETDAKLGA
jgi:hypothetical protein